MVVDQQHFAPEDYQVFRNFLSQACGIVLGDGKQYLVINRIRRILDEYQLASLRSLVALIQRGEVPHLKERVIDAMTTNETSWFRDGAPFDALRDILLPRLVIEQRRMNLRIWSAACSSGQEPYSISMVVEEFKSRHPGTAHFNPEILATDISTAVLAAAREAEYDRLGMGRGLSEQRRQQFFDELPHERYRLKPSVTRRVTFRQLNLLDSFGGLGRFDIVFCRNVLIYFSAERKLDILRRMHTTLNPSSCLLLGASESLPSQLSDQYLLERLTANTSVYLTG